MREVTLLLLFLIPPISYSQIGEYSTGARSYSLAGNSTQLKDLWSIENNPAAISFIKDWRVGLSYENSFLLKELSNRSLLFSSPIQKGSIGLSYQQYGYSAFNQNKLGLSYGKLLAENFSMGLQLNYLNTKIEEGYGSRNSLSGNIGILTNVTTELIIALTIINLNRSKLASYDDERYPTKINLGLGYKLSTKVLFLTEITKDIAYEANLKTGIEYQIGEVFHLRLGYATNPSLNSFGFGFKLENLKLDIASSLNYQLGLTSQVSLSYIPSTNKK